MTELVFGGKRKPNTVWFVGPRMQSHLKSHVAAADFLRIILLKYSLKMIESTFFSMKINFYLNKPQIFR